MTVAEVATLTGLAPHNLDSLRTRGYGPPWVLAAAGLRYRRSDVEAWLAQVLREREREVRRSSQKRTADEEWLTLPEAAKLIGIDPDVLRNMRHRGTGPPSFLDAAGRIRYRAGEVEAWLLDDQDRINWLALPFHVRIGKVRQRLARLQERIREQCPGGPEHAYVDHQDSRPPWCDACRYTDTGLRLNELGTGSY